MWGAEESYRRLQYAVAVCVGWVLRAAILEVLEVGLTELTAQLFEVKSNVITPRLIERIK